MAECRLTKATCFAVAFVLCAPPLAAESVGAGNQTITTSNDPGDAVPIDSPPAPSLAQTDFLRQGGAQAVVEPRTPEAAPEPDDSSTEVSQTSPDRGSDDRSQDPAPARTSDPGETTYRVACQTPQFICRGNVSSPYPAGTACECRGVRGVIR